MKLEFGLILWIIKGSTAPVDYNSLKPFLMVNSFGANIIKIFSFNKSVSFDFYFSAIRRHSRIVNNDFITVP